MNYPQYKKNISTFVFSEAGLLCLLFLYFLWCCFMVYKDIHPTESCSYLPIFLSVRVNRTCKAVMLKYITSSNASLQLIYINLFIFFIIVASYMSIHNQQELEFMYSSLLQKIDLKIDDVHHGFNDFHHVYVSLLLSTVNVMTVHGYMHYLTCTPTIDISRFNVLHYYIATEDRHNYNHSGFWSANIDRLYLWRRCSVYLRIFDLRYDHFYSHSMYRHCNAVINVIDTAHDINSKRAVLHHPKIVFIDPHVPKNKEPLVGQCGLFGYVTGHKTSGIFKIYDAYFEQHTISNNYRREFEYLERQQYYRNNRCYYVHTYAVDVT